MTHAINIGLAITARLLAPSLGKELFNDAGVKKTSGNDRHCSAMAWLVLAV